MFQDSAKIFIQSGNGGDGHVSFRRELFVPAGGPDGGDGGRGGDIIFEVYDGLNTLVDFRHKRKYTAENGQPGGKRRCHGADGADLVIRVPEGTVIRDDETGKVIADVGLVGFPNVGKSTLLSRVSNAKPEIANYHFTTLSPHLGVVDVADGEGFVMADLPGLIEGASEGVGLGYDFLKHVERTKVLVHVVDAASVEGRDPVDDVKKIMEELAKYDASLLSRPQLIAANKIDCIYDDGETADPIQKLRDAFEPEIKVYPISGVSGEGIRELKFAIWELLQTLDRTVTVFEPEIEIDYTGDKNLPYTVVKEAEGVFVVEGPRVEKMLGYTNLESEKGFDFFQKFLKNSGILDDLEKLGIQEGDTVRMYGHTFDYYK